MALPAYKSEKEQNGVIHFLRLLQHVKASAAVFNL
jgi:hypothetical protein